MNPIIGIDIDGVLADYPLAMKLAAERIGIEVPGLTAPTTYRMIEDGWFTDRADWRRAHEIVTAELDDMDVQAPGGAAEAVDRIREAGGDIWIVTSRKAPRWQSVYDDEDVAHGTSTWLREQGIQFDRLVQIDEKWSLPLTTMVDDAPYIIEGFGDDRAVIFDQAYNADLPGLRVHSMSEYADHVLGVIGRR